MCGLCGLLGPQKHWSDGDDRLPGLKGPAERQRRTAMANRLLAPYGLALGTWANRYVLSGQTGRREVVDGLGSLWAAAERLAGRACDPLDLQFIAAMRDRG